MACIRLRSNSRVLLSPTLDTDDVPANRPFQKAASFERKLDQRTSELSDHLITKFSNVRHPHTIEPRVTNSTSYAMDTAEFLAWGKEAGT